MSLRSIKTPSWRGVGRNAVAADVPITGILVSNRQASMWGRPRGIDILGMSPIDQNSRCALPQSALLLLKPLKDWSIKGYEGT